MFKKISHTINNLFFSIKEKSELDILVSILFKSDLKELIQDLSADIDFLGRATVTIAYIDKRPIVDFKSPYINKSIEIGDLLIALKTRCHVIHRNEESKRGVNSNSIYIQTKKSTGHISPKDKREHKQFFLYEKWPEFFLKKPAHIGRFNNTKSIVFNNSNELNNPGGFLQFNKSHGVLGYNPSQYAHQIPLNEYLNMFFKSKIGRSFTLQDEYSKFTHDLIENSKQSTFERKSIFKEPTPRVLSYINSKGTSTSSFTTALKKYSYEPDKSASIFHKILFIIKYLLKKQFITIEIELLYYDY